MTLLLDQTQLEIVLSPLERAVAFHRDNLRVSREAITKVQLTDDAWTWLRGVPGPGTRIPGVLAAGTWKATATTDFVIIRRNRPGVVIELDGDPEFQRMIFTTRHGLALAQALHLDAPEEQLDVVEIANTAPVRVPQGRRRPVIRPRPA